VSHFCSPAVAVALLPSVPLASPCAWNNLVTESWRTSKPRDLILFSIVRSASPVQACLRRFLSIFFKLPSEQLFLTSAQHSPLQPAHGCMIFFRNSFLHPFFIDLFPFVRAFITSIFLCYWPMRLWLPLDQSIARSVLHCRLSFRAPVIISLSDPFLDLSDVLPRCGNRCADCRGLRCHFTLSPPLRNAPGIFLRFDYGSPFPKNFFG